MSRNSTTPMAMGRYPLGDFAGSVDDRSDSEHFNDDASMRDCSDSEVGNGLAVARPADAADGALSDIGVGDASEKSKTMVMDLSSGSAWREVPLDSHCEAQCSCPASGARAPLWPASRMGRCCDVVRRP